MQYRKIALALLACLSLGSVCCSVVRPVEPTVPVVQQLPKPECTKESCSVPPVDLTPKNLGQRAAGPTWTYEVQRGWTRIESGDLPDTSKTLKLQMELKGKDPSGEETMAFVIMTTPWKESDELFAIAAAKAYLDGGPFTLVDAEAGELFEHPSSMIILTTPDKSVLAIQIAVASAGTGHVMRCVGSSADVDELINSCMRAFSGFKLRNVTSL